MALSSQQRWWVLGTALLLTMAAVFAVQQTEEPADSATEHKRNDIANVRIAQTSALTALSVTHVTAAAGLEPQSLLPEIEEKRKQAQAMGVAQPHPDLLSRHAWYVPPAPQAEVSTPVAKPEAPAAPFQYMGKLENSPQGTLIFLSTAGSMGKVQSVIPGQLINSNWRLDSEDASALYLTYIPLGTAQVLSKTAQRTVNMQAEAETNQANQDGQ